MSDEEEEDPCLPVNDDPLPDSDLDDEAQQQAQQPALAPAVLPPSPQHLDFHRCIHRLGGDIVCCFREIVTLDAIMPPIPPVVYSEFARGGVSGEETYWSYFIYIAFFTYDQDSAFSVQIP